MRRVSQRGARCTIELDQRRIQPEKVKSACPPGCSSEVQGRGGEQNKYAQSAERRYGSRPWRTRTQSSECRVDIPRDAWSCSRGVRVGKIVACVWNTLCRGPAPISGVGIPLRSATLPSDGGSGGRLHRRPPTGGGAAATTRFANDAIVGRNVTTLSNLLRMLYSRAGDYPSQPLLYAESFLQIQLRVHARSVMASAASTR